MTDVAHPDIRWVVFPVHLDGTPTGAVPRMRHYEKCPHFSWGDGTLLGTPVQATPEQLASLPACKTCVQYGPDYEANMNPSDRIGEPCPTCFMALPLTGICDNCA